MARSDKHEKMRWRVPMPAADSNNSRHPKKYRKKFHQDNKINEEKYLRLRKRHEKPPL